jgi:hypothetical protein
MLKKYKEFRKPNIKFKMLWKLKADNINNMGKL